MFSSVFVVFAGFVCVGVYAAATEHPFYVIKRDIESRSTSLREHQQGGVRSKKQAKGASGESLRHAHSQSSIQEISLYAYNATGCSSSELMFMGAYGTNICVTATSTQLLLTESTMFTYSGGVITQNFYSDLLCTVLIDSQTVVDFASYSAGSCHTIETVSFEYDVGSSFSLPNADGFYTAEYVSSSACNSASQPFFAGWFYDFIELDDYFDISCSLETVSFNDDLDDDDDDGDDDGIEWYTEAYVSVGTTTESSSTSTSCFSGSETVQLESGEIVPISTVTVGDKILGADLNGVTKYSQVIAVPHARNNEVAIFTHLETLSGGDIKMTPDHLTVVNKACDATTVSELMQATQVTADMCLLTTRGLDRVLATSETVSREGVYTVVLQDTDLLVVNGVIASPFSVNHAVANAYYNVIRILPVSLTNSLLWNRANLLFGALASSFGLY